MLLVSSTDPSLQKSIQGERTITGGILLFFNGKFEEVKLTQI